MKKKLPLLPALLSIISAALNLGLSFALSFLLAPLMQSGTAGFYAAAGLTTVLSCAASLSVFLISGKRSLHTAGEAAVSIPASALYIISAAALCTGFDIIVSLLSGGSSDGRLTASVPLALITLALLPAAAEELLFRGAILNAMRQYGDVWGVIFSSLLFAAVHAAPAAALLAFLSGLVLGFVRIKTGRLLAPMAVHFLINSAAIIISAP